MTNLDQFESVFRSAAKAVFKYERVEIGSVLVITDLDEAGAATLGNAVEAFLRTVVLAEAVRVLPGDAFETARDLIELVEREHPDLICTYRHLHSDGWNLPYTLGDHVEVLTQASSYPVLVLPHPKAGRASAHAMSDTSVVMAMTDHLTGDDRLVNFAARLTGPRGKLLLTHVEDEVAFDRVIDAISKIPMIDTDTARDEIRKQMLKEPHDYVSSCREVLQAAGVDVVVEDIVLLGHHLAEYRKLVEEHEVDLLVLNTKDDEQLAMHGLAYPLVVELRQIPLLML